ncbi:signal peptidase II [Indioceanicola profundi]|uniref:signal peptidase II n=1 Tax=Indioceanicola profundi TaxID=2220096 RepID=UPI000E6AB3D6|nr:signal peptidase II [Indioceanicola profundi]
MVGDTVAPPAVRRRMLGIGFGIAVIAMLLDQVSKWWILDVMLPCLSGPSGPWCQVQAPPIEVTGFFNLVMAWNRGVSFGMFAHEADLMPYVLIAVALAITAFLVVWLRRTDRVFQAVCIGLVIGGALGNVIDRLRFGAVADFLDVHVAGWHWPAFNVADSCIVVGVLLLVADGLFDRRDRQ